MKFTHLLALTFSTIILSANAAGDFNIGGFDPGSGSGSSASNPSTAGVAAAAIRNVNALLHDASSPSVGSGPVTLVEFFDYECPHCTVMSPEVAQLAASNSNLRVIYKEFPIRGEVSTLAARAALAANLQGKYRQMHESLMSSSKTLSAAKINEMAQILGLDINKFKADMDSAAVTQAINSNYQLAKALGVYGTPTFIVMRSDSTTTTLPITVDVVLGQVAPATLQKLISKHAT